MSQFNAPHRPPGGDFDNSHLGTPGIAIVAVICGVLGLLILPVAIVGLICGIIGMTKATNGRPGYGVALTGTILGGVGLLTSTLAVFLTLIMLPAMEAARTTAQRMQNSTQLRGIHQGMVTYANANRNNFPGLNSKGQVLGDGSETGNSGSGDMPQARIWIMIENDFFSPVYAISPLETDPSIVEHGGPGTGSVAGNHYSYAMLSFVKDTSQSYGAPPAYGVQPGSAYRVSEWKQTLNSQAVVLSDRNTGTDPGNGIQSFHVDVPGSWEGSVIWNDNSVGFERQALFETRYGSASLNRGPNGPTDHLFIDDAPTANQSVVGANALMVHDTVQ